ncbi:uncharacterized protein [Centruroides vittatus]|uniref:uncharacterized protein isoform X2 n=1 Tax=Centruroides vittatus TaxID=120091 RepID=UPI003510AE79
MHQHKREHLEQKKITESDYIYLPTKSKCDNNLNRKNWEMEPNKTETAKKSLQYQKIQKYQKDFNVRNKSDKSKSNASEREHVIQKETNSHTNSASRNHSKLHRNQLEENSEVSYIISRYLNSRNKINMASVYSSFLPLLSQTNIPSEDSQTSETSVDFNKELFERLIVEVIHENLQNLHLTSEKNTVSDISEQSLSKHTDEQSLEEKAGQQDSLHGYDDDQQDSLHGDDDQPYSLDDNSKQNSSKSKTKYKVEQEISKSITTAGNNVELKEDSAQEMPFNYEKVELPATPDISISEKSSPNISVAAVMPGELPSTPSISEQEFDVEEEAAHSSTKDIEIINVHPVSTPSFTSSSHSNPSPEPVLTPEASPSQRNSEPLSLSRQSNKKSMQDVAVQVSRLSDSIETTAITTTSNSLSESTDEIISDGELLLANYRQAPVLKKKKESKKKFDKLVMQNYQSSYSEGEIHLISIDKSFYNKQHEKDTDSSSELPEQNQEQISEDISEGQVTLQNPTKYLKLFLDPLSHVKPVRDLSSHSLSEGEITESNQSKNPFLSSSVLEHFNIDEMPVKDNSNSN